MPSEHAGAVTQSAGIATTLVFRELQQFLVEGLMRGYGEAPDRGGEAIEPGAVLAASGLGAACVRLRGSLRDQLGCFGSCLHRPARSFGRCHHFNGLAGHTRPFGATEPSTIVAPRLR